MSNELKTLALGGEDEEREPMKHKRKQRTFRTVNQVFEYYLPEYTKRKRREKMTPSEIGKEIAGEILDDFKRRIKL